MINPALESAAVNGRSPASPTIEGSGKSSASRPMSSGAARLNQLAVPLGLAGLAGVWQALRTTVHAPAWPAEVLFAVSGALWLALTAAYLLGGLRRRGSFAEDRRHPVYGPYAGYVPAIGILVAGHYGQYLHDTARVVVAVLVVALGILIAQLVAYWLLGNLPSQAIHPGYFLPTVAGPFVAAIGLGFSGWRDAAEAAFGVGVFFWFVIGSLIFSRLFTGAPLPDPVKPSLAVLVSGPATGGIAWFIISGGQLNTVEYILLGITFMMLAVQLLLVGEYRRLTFSPNFWAFTFPATASTTLIVRWLAAARFPGWQAWCWSIAGLATAFVISIAAATVTGQAHQVRRRTARPPAPRARG